MLPSGEISVPSGPPEASSPKPPLLLLDPPVNPPLRPDEPHAAATTRSTHESASDARSIGPHVAPAGAPGRPAGPGGEREETRLALLAPLRRPWYGP